MPSVLPTRVLAGITVPDTPLITKALDFARTYLEDVAYNHVVRSWLFGQHIVSHVPELQNCDIELLSIATILHDMGWDKTGALISPDKRFEVDGANITRDFLIREGKKEEWDAHRLQLAWDAIALHTTGSIALHKEVEVKSCIVGVMVEFLGPERSFGGVMTRDVYNGIVEEFPRLGFKEGVKTTLCGLCKNKPETTYDNFTAEFGVAFVDGYSLEGNRFLDLYNAMED